MKLSIREKWLAYAALSYAYSNVDDLNEALFESGRPAPEGEEYGPLTEDEVAALINRLDLRKAD